MEKKRSCEGSRAKGEREREGLELIAWVSNKEPPSTTIHKLTSQSSSTIGQTVSEQLVSHSTYLSHPTSCTTEQSLLPRCLVCPIIFRGIFFVFFFTLGLNNRSKPRRSSMAWACWIASWQSDREGRRRTMIFFCFNPHTVSAHPRSPFSSESILNFPSFSFSLPGRRNSWAYPPLSPPSPLFRHPTN